MSDSVDRFESVSVFGGGAWGTALGALHAQSHLEADPTPDNGGVSAKTLLWTRNPKVVRAINEQRENTLYLPGIALAPNVMATDDIDRAAKSEAILFVVPAQQSRPLLKRLRDVCEKQGAVNKSIALCSKGIEKNSLMLVHELLLDVWPEARVSILSGPSFAHDVAVGLPAAVTLASASATQGERWLKSISARHFRPYYSDDLTGVALGGAVKNVLAIAAGIVDGMALGESAHAGLIARGYAEFQRLGLAMGAKPATMAGLSGLGDLILTAGSSRSRNMSLGQMLGSAAKERTSSTTLDDLLSTRNSVSEGVASSSAVVGLARKFNVEMPVCETVASIVEERYSVQEAIDYLMSRPLRAEIG